jgi:diphthamide synthase (EF-2-diphthine--ammonia ligase)
MTQVLDRARAEGISVMAFGDLFLEDIRQYREDRLASTGVTPLFPLWGRPTASLARDMIGSHLRASVTCVDPRQLSAAFAGRSFDASFLADLPLTVDPCGERGEFHTFAWDGPMFTELIAVRRGETVERDGFIFTDLLPHTLTSRQ